jgi:hypothetical protein
VKLLAASFGLLAAYESALAIGRFQRRKRVFAEAQARAKLLGRPLVVVGDPDAGAHTRLARAYPCGDACVDIRGCPRCRVSIEDDITEGLDVFEDDSAIVYVACVLEYVSEPTLAQGELLRIAGRRENLFIVYVDPWSLTSVLYPGAQWRATDDGRWVNTEDIRKKGLVAGVVAATAALFLQAAS